MDRGRVSARLELILIRIGLYLALAGDFDARPQGLADSPSDLPDLTSPDLPSPDLPSPDLPAEVLELPSVQEELLPPAEPALEIDING